MQILQIDRDLNSEIGKELHESNSKIGELVERKVAAEDQLNASRFRVLQTGMVYQSNVHTVGGMISGLIPSC